MSPSLDRQKISALTYEDPLAAYAQVLGERWAILLTQVPEHIRGGLVRYILLGIPPGDFLQAVLSNDLMESFARADDETRRGLFRICVFLHEAAPSGCFRGEDRMRAWIRQGGAVLGALGEEVVS
jgi:hypothetical protein